MEKFSLSTFQLKVIAIISMLIDHTGAILFPGQMWFRIIGRFAFPIFTFLLVEGFFHTRDVKKYAVRLLLFAFISEFIFDYAFFGEFFSWTHQNVFFTLFLGVLLMGFWNYFQGKIYLQLPFALFFIWMGDVLATDYGSFGVLLIAMFFWFRDLKPFFVKLLCGAGFFILRSGIIAYGAYAMIPIALYKGRKGPSMKYFFYIFYPIHLLLLVLIKKAMPLY